MKNQYEIAYHLVATLDPSELAAAVDRIRTAIEKNGGAIVEETSPARFELAYPIKKNLGGKYETHEASQFGFVRVEAGEDIVEQIEQVLAEDPLVLRSFVVACDPTQTKKKKPRSASVLQRPDDAKAEAPEQEREPAMTNEAIDKEIDKLIVE